MDWLPTLLAAAGTAPDPAYPSDGMNLLPVLTEGVPRLSPRTLYWRYKARAQRAMRDGDLKFLKILDHTFLFDVVADPLERANLKERRKDDYQRLVRQWLAWNATMLPEVAGSYHQRIQRRGPRRPLRRRRARFDAGRSGARRLGREQSALSRITCTSY